MPRRAGHIIAIAPPAATERTELPLTPEHRAIVEHYDGPVMVIAGTGTTRVVVQPVRWLQEMKNDRLPHQKIGFAAGHIRRVHEYLRWKAVTSA